MTSTTTGHDPRVTRTRAAVLDAAKALLIDDGIAALTVEAVVQRSGVARSTIYRHWPTRTDLVADAMARVLQPLAPPPPGPLRDRLHELIERFVSAAAG